LVYIKGFSEPMRVQLGGLTAEQMRALLQRQIQDGQADPRSAPGWVLVDSGWHYGPSNVIARADAITGFWIEEVKR
jgi:hypothetical protein